MNKESLTLDTEDLIGIVEELDLRLYKLETQFQNGEIEAKYYQSKSSKVKSLVKSVKHQLSKG